MRVNGISSAVSTRAAVKTSASEAKSVNEGNSISSLTNPGAASFGLSFAGAGRIIELDKDTAKIEKDITDKMRRLGVNIPKIKNNSYEIHGNPAHPYTNPITDKHIKNVLNNV